MLMASITLNRKTAEYDPKLLSYKMIVEVTAAQDITPKIFVNQRLYNFFKTNFEDVVVAIATPTQIEDFGEDAPNEGDSYFRTSKVEVVCRTLEALEYWYAAVVGDLQRLVLDVDVLTELTDEADVTISS